MGRILTLPTVGSEFTVQVNGSRRKVAAVNSFAVTEAEPTTTETPTFDGPIAVTEAPGLPSAEVGVAAILPHTPMAEELRRLYRGSLVGVFRHYVPGAVELSPANVTVAIATNGAITWGGSAATEFRKGINDDVYAPGMALIVGAVAYRIKSVTKDTGDGSVGTFILEDDDHPSSAVAAAAVKLGTFDLRWDFTAKVTGPGSLNQSAGAAATTSLRLQPQAQWDNPTRGVPGTLRN